MPTPARGHYFAHRPDSPHRERTVRLLLPDLALDLATDSGVFSPRAVDAGTRFLLARGGAIPAPARVIVDLGAGYGPIACALAARHPQAEVWAVEINERARDLCRSNAAANGLANLRVVTPEEVPRDFVIDALWSNPPIRIGKEALWELLTSWLERLGPDGEARFVVNKHLGSDSLHARLTADGWRARRVASRSGYRILAVSPQEPTVRDSGR